MEATATQNTALQSKNIRYYINAFITIAIMFGFGYLPPIAPITPLGMKILGKKV